METLAFYSYAGGVGRTLLVANAARYLASLGKGVVALDLDFESPGLHYKLAGPADNREQAGGTGGAVPYLLATAEGSTSPPPLEEHLVEIPVPSASGGWLRIMPAGPAPDRTYWTALKRLGEKVRFDDPSGQGLLSLLDLHARIEDELQPGHLLIDISAGVTELGGIATTLLADTVVCMVVASRESLEGTLKVAEAIRAAPRLKGQRPVRVVPVLARATSLPPVGSGLASYVVRILKHGNPVADKPDRFFVLPHDEIYGATERLLGREEMERSASPLAEAYLELFQELFPSAA